MINRVLLYNSGGGVGDSIQLLSLIDTLKSKFTNAKFYYLSAHTNYFNLILKDYKTNINTLNLDIKYFGFRWWHALILNRKIKKNNIEAFDLIIDLQTKIRNSLILKLIPHKYFISSCLNFKLSKPSPNIKKDKKVNRTILNAINSIFKENLKINKFDINKIDKKFFTESERLLPDNNYIGFSITQGNVYRKKEWPLKSIIKLANKFIEGKKRPVFFIEKKNIELKNKIQKFIPLALFPEFQTNLNSPALVTCLGKRLNFSITIDNGVMHMLSLSETPMVVLFGPTKSEKFAPDYSKVIILDSKKIKSTSDISSISVEDVLLAIKQHSNFSF